MSTPESRELTRLLASVFLQGPSSSTDEAFALFDGTTGKLLKELNLPGSSVIVRDNAGSPGTVTASDHGMLAFNNTLGLWFLADVQAQEVVGRLTAATPLQGIPVSTNEAFGRGAGSIGGIAVSEQQLLGRVTGGSLSGLDRTDIVDILTIDRDVSTVTVTNDNSFNTIYSFTVPGNVLGTTRAIRIRIHGDYTNNSGGDQRVMVKTTYGSTAMHDSGSSEVISTSATTWAWDIDLDLWAEGATGSQRHGGRFLLVGSGAPSSGYGGHESNSDINTMQLGGTASEDSTGDLTFKVEMKHALRDPDVTYNKYTAYAQLI